MLSFLDQSTVPLRKVFWVGVVIAIFNPPVVGIVYALLFAFRRETRRTALIIGVWAIVWTVIYSLLLHSLVSTGYVRISL